MKNISLLILFFASFNIAQSLPFTENFIEGDLSVWLIVDDEPQYSGPSNWFIEEGILRQTSNIWAYVAPDEFKYHLGTHIITGNEKWDDYSFNVMCKATDNDGIGIIFRYVDSKNYYRFLLMQDGANGGPIQRLQKFVDGEPFTIYEKKNSPAIPQGWFALTADIRNDLIKIYINGEIFTEQKDNQFVEGKIGLSCYAMSGAYFDSITVSHEEIVYDKPEEFEVEEDRLPYIQLPDTNSVTIAWRTKQKYTGKVEYGLTENFGHFVLEDSSTNKHVLLLEELEPGTKYYYKVWNNNTVFNQLDSFYTAKPDNVKNVSFLIWGDSGTGSETQMKIASLLTKETADFAVHLGDVSQSDGSKYDEIFFKPYKSIVNRMCIYTCIGNHDTYYDNAQTYLEDFYLPSNNKEQKERYYSYRWGSAFFINLDSNIDYVPGSPQYEFLVSQLESDRRLSADWTFVYFHHPAYCELWDSWSGEQKVRDYLLPLFEEYKVDMVLNGHTHGYEKGELNGVYYIISGGGGGGLDTYGRDWSHITKSISKHHYSKIEISGQELKFTATDIDGKELDSFNITKNLTSASQNVETVPNGLKLEQNYPNPFNSSTIISFSIPQTGKLNSNVYLNIYNLLGEKVTAKNLGIYSSGNYKINFNAAGLAGGIYFYNISVGDYSKSLKMVYLK